MQQRSDAAELFEAPVTSVPSRPAPQRACEAKSDAVEEDLHTLVESNLNFVLKIANEYRNRGVPFEDLLNEGSVGLLQAAKRYDPSRGVKFITYAVWWIRKTMLKAIAEHTRLVRIPDYQRKRLRQVRDAERTLLSELGHGVDPAELPARLVKEIAALERARQAQRREIRLDEKVGEDGKLRVGGTLRDALPSPEEAFIKAEALRLVGIALGGLTIRERRVLGLRYGFGAERGLSLQEAGKVLGISGERVRQIEAVALVQMKKSLTTGRRARAPLRRARSQP